MSRLNEIDSQLQQEPEPEGYEFGYYIFDSLPDIKVTDIQLTINSITDIKTKDTSGHNVQGFPIDNDVCKNYNIMMICFLCPFENQDGRRSHTSLYRSCILQIWRLFKMSSDNGTEFKNKMFEQISKEHGLEYKVYTPPYHPASNNRIEGFHAFLKACIAKHVAPQLEWDVLIPLACAAYNFIPNEHSKESPFFLMFGRDPVLPLNTLLGPKMRYLGNDLNILFLEAMKNMFEIVATNLKMAREKRDPENNPLPTKLQHEDTVLVQNHTKGPFDPKYMGDY